MHASSVRNFIKKPVNIAALVIALAFLPRAIQTVSDFSGWAWHNAVQIPLEKQSQKAKQDHEKRREKMLHLITKWDRKHKDPLEKLRHDILSRASYPKLEQLCSGDIDFRRVEYQERFGYAEAVRICTSGLRVDYMNCYAIMRLQYKGRKFSDYEISKCTDKLLATSIFDPEDVAAYWKAWDQITSLNNPYLARLNDL